MRLFSKTAYHSTKTMGMKEFNDVTDLTFAYKGEGAMIHGWGLYLQESKDINKDRYLSGFEKWEEKEFTDDKISHTYNHFQFVPRYGNIFSNDGYAFEITVGGKKYYGRSFENEYNNPYNYDLDYPEMYWYDNRQFAGEPLYKKYEFESIAFGMMIDHDVDYCIKHLDDSIFRLANKDEYTMNNWFYGDETKQEDIDYTINYCTELKNYIEQHRSELDGSTSKLLLDGYEDMPENYSFEINGHGDSIIGIDGVDYDTVLDNNNEFVIAPVKVLRDTHDNATDEEKNDDSWIDKIPNDCPYYNFIDRFQMYLLDTKPCSLANFLEEHPEYIEFVSHHDITIYGISTIKKRVKTAGAQYMVNIPDDWLLIDEAEPLESMNDSDVITKVIRKFWKLADRTGITYDEFEKECLSLSGKEFYEICSKLMGGSEQRASWFLADNGIKGMHYYGGIDGSCYVIFDCDGLEIIGEE